MAIVNCIECGKVFVKGMDKICPDCVKKREMEVSKINDWIKSRPKASLENIEAEIGVDYKTFIKHFIEGRIRSFSNVVAKCEVCSKETGLTAKNVICPDCRNSLKKSHSYRKPGEMENSSLYSKADLLDKFKKR